MGQPYSYFPVFGSPSATLKLLETLNIRVLKRLSLRGSTPSLATIIPKNLAEIWRQETGKITRGDHPRLRPLSRLVEGLLLPWSVSMSSDVPYRRPPTPRQYVVHLEA